MTYSAHVYTKSALSAWSKKIDVTADTFKAIPLSAYTLGTTRDTAQFLADILAGGSPPGTEAAGGTYVAGGVALAGVAFTLDSVNHRYVLSCSGPIVFSTTTPLSVTHVLIVDTTPATDATRPLIEYWDLGGAQNLLSISPDTNGLVRVTHS